MLIFIGCNRFDIPVDTSQQHLTSEQKSNIIKSMRNISDKFNDIIINDSLSFEQLDLILNADTTIDYFWYDRDNLYVKYKNGGTVNWTKPIIFIKPPWINKVDKNSKSKEIPLGKNLDNNLINEIIGNKKVCLINQAYNDENNSYCKEIIQELQNNFQGNGFEVDIINGESFNLEFIKTKLTKYGVIFLITHGGFNSNYTWFLSGEINKDLMSLSIDIEEQWRNEKIIFSRGRKELRGGIEKEIEYIGLSSKFIDEIYNINSFPNSFFYTVACQSLKGFDLATVLYNKGVSIYLGWDEKNSIGASSGKLLFDFLLCGRTVGEAIDDLPFEAKHEYFNLSNPDRNETINYEANLKLFPRNNYVLGRKIIGNPINNNIYIDLLCPLNGADYGDRVLTVTGSLMNAELERGYLEINGITSQLSTIDNNFEQRVLIKSGENRIKIVCFGFDYNNSRAIEVSKDIVFQGIFDPFALFTELRWNTDDSDVDLHLLPPNSTINDLWTDIDCYFLHKNPLWGAFLDIDDVNGWGPEHITIPNYILSGEYTLYIHYYDNHGAVGPTNAFISVVTSQNKLNNFGPYSLTTSGKEPNFHLGDVYEVCKIIYPSGEIIPVNRKVYLTGISGNRKNISK